MNGFFKAVVRGWVGPSGADLSDAEIQKMVASSHLRSAGNDYTIAAGGDTEQIDREKAERIRHMSGAEIANVRRLIAARDKAWRNARRFVR